MEFFDLLLWPINTVLAVMGIALASLELQERKITRDIAAQNPQTLEFDSFAVEVSTDLETQRLHEQIRTELELRQNSRVVLPKWAIRRQHSYFIPLRRKGYVHESRRGIWMPWGLLSLRYGPLVVVLGLVIIQSIQQGQGGTFSISYLALAGLFLSIIWTIVAFVGIYVEAEGKRSYLICGPIRISEVSLNSIEVIQKSAGRFGVLACVDTIRHPGFQLCFLHDNCDLQDAVAQTVSAVAILRPTQSESRTRVRVSRDFTDPVKDRMEGFEEKVRWGLLAFYNLVARQIERKP